MSYDECPPGYTKYLINRDYGVFEFSEIFCQRFCALYPERKGDVTGIVLLGIRTDPDVVALFEEMGPSFANGPKAFIKVWYVRSQFAAHLKLCANSTHFPSGKELIEVDYDSYDADICDKLVAAIEKGEPTQNLVAAHKSIPTLMKKDPIIWTS